MSAGGASGANRCHAAIAWPAWDHGHETKKYAAPAALCVFSVSAVTTPKLPLPPFLHV